MPTAFRNDYGSTVGARPDLSASQLSFRIGLARKRMANYPLDSMDFIMMDLERPDLCSRHAHWCTGDLTGRILEFLSCADGVDGASDPRLGELFERILRQRRPSGLFGRYAGSPRNEIPEDDALSGCDRLFSGFVRYYDLTGDWRALDAALGIAERILSVKDAWSARLRPCGTNPIWTWITEPFAKLYGITGDQRFIDFCGFVDEHIVHLTGSHSHGLMSSMRGLQIAAMLTGDSVWNEKPERFRRRIIDEHCERPDGCVSEVFPRSFRNEGCSIADWLMVNLNAAMISGDDATYDKAETILWNALFHNQLVTGGFGHRDLTANGYAMSGVSEAWWCCTEHCGMAMTEYARHAIVYKDGVLRVNLLVPGKYVLPVVGRTVEVVINTAYPESAEASVNVTGLPDEAKIRVRIPSCIKDAQVTERQDNRGRRIVLSGRLGHTIEECDDGVMLKYGPLVLSPSVYYWNANCDIADNSVPEGYIPDSMPAGIPAIISGECDSHGLLSLPSQPLPDWSYFDEGPGARFCVGRAAVNVPLEFSNGETRELRFWPICYNTSSLSLYEVPIVFSRRSPKS